MNGGYTRTSHGLAPDWGQAAPTPTTRPTPTGEPGRIFFQSNRDGNPHIYSMNADGTDVARLTTTGGNLSPSVSPGGERVAWIHAGDVWTMGVDGTDRQQVTDTPSVEESPTWSPDGTRIAYVSRTSPDGGNDQEIWVRPADGTGSAVQLTANTFPDVEPAWSPVMEGAPQGRIAFVSTRSGDTNRNVYVMDPDGGAVLNLTPNGQYDGLAFQGHDDDPAWSADGRIAFSHTFQPNASGLPAVWSVVPDGTGLTRISTDSTQSATEPSWSPDATSIAYVGTAGTNRDIAVMSADGTGGHHIDTATNQHLPPFTQPRGLRALSHSR